MGEAVPSCRDGKPHYWVFERQVPGARECKAKCKRCKETYMFPVYLEPNPFKANWHGRRKKPDAG